MKNLLILVSIISLLLTIIPSFLVFFDVISLDLNKTLMLIGTLGWFLTAPYWMNKKESEEEV
jgi:hypothetical protein